MREIIFSKKTAISLDKLLEYIGNRMVSESEKRLYL